MPFTPLPKTFLDDLARLLGGRVVEFGCGDGLLTAQLRRHGADPVAMDRRPPAHGSVADVVADALQAPLGHGRIALIVAGNLLRHLWPLPQHAPVPDGWRGALAPGGCLYLFEDEPVARPAAARHYRDLQAFLARLVPESRRPLLALADFRQACAADRAAAGWSFGTAANRWPVNRRDVLAWLEQPGLSDDGEAARLVGCIRADGIGYGTYWWARWCDEEATR
jgi:SAM-dependent methyltransferase